MSTAKAIPWDLVFAWMTQHRAGPREAARAFVLPAGTVLAAAHRERKREGGGRLADHRPRRGRKARNLPAPVIPDVVDVPTMPPAPPPRTPRKKKMIENEERPVAAVEWVPVQALDAWTKNPNTHPLEQIRQLASGIERFGFVVPIVVYDCNGKMEIRAGHGRREAMQSLLRRNPEFRAKNAPPEAPPGAVLVLRLPVASRAEADAYGLSDQALSALGQFDEDIASTLLRELSGDGVSVLAIGFDDRLDLLLGDLTEVKPKGKGFGAMGTKGPSSKRNVTVEMSILVPSQWDLVEQAIQRLRVESPGITVGEAFVSLARGYLRGRG